MRLAASELASKNLKIGTFEYHVFEPNFPELVEYVIVFLELYRNLKHQQNGYLSLVCGGLTRLWLKISTLMLWVDLLGSMMVSRIYGSNLRSLLRKKNIPDAVFRKIF